MLRAQVTPPGPQFPQAPDCTVSTQEQGVRVVESGAITELKERGWQISDLLSGCGAPYVC